MMMRACKQTGILSLVVLLLTACGGGGGGGAANVMPTNPSPGPGGNVGEDMTPAQWRNYLDQRLTALKQNEGTAYLASDLALFTPSTDLTVFHETECSGSVCRVPSLEASESVAEFSLPDSITPIMRDRDIMLLDYAHEDLEDTAAGYGGVLDHSMFFSVSVMGTSGDFSGSSWYYGASFGLPASGPDLTTDARWSGVMVGTDVEGENRGTLVRGNADLSLDFDTATVDLTFSNVRERTSGRELPGITWSDMPVVDVNTFSGRNARGETAGRSYGAGHVEAGGTFRYDELVGAYGMKRQ